MEMKNNEVEAKLSKIDAAIQKIYNEKETLKAQIEKQKTTIDFLQNKSLSLSNSAASEAIQKLNESMKVKTGEVTNLKTKNKQLAGKLAELQNNVNGKSRKEDESDKCPKLTKVVSNKSKEVTELKTERKK